MPTGTNGSFCADSKSVGRATRSRCTEALAFALAAHIPISKAQAIVKEAAQAEGGSLTDRVAAVCRDRGIATPDTVYLDVCDLAGMWINRSLGRAGKG